MSADPLGWVELDRSHVAELQVFVCTDPEKPVKNASTGWQLQHPRIWEYDAQQTIRTYGKKWRTPPECTVLVGVDGHGLAAVSGWTELDGPSWVHLDVMGVAQRLRQRGEQDASKRVGTAAMQQTLSRIEAKALEAGCDRMYVEGEVFRDNDASLRMVEHFGFTFVTEAPTGAQTWAFEYAFAFE